MVSIINYFFFEELGIRYAHPRAICPHYVRRWGISRIS